MMEMSFFLESELDCAADRTGRNRRDPHGGRDYGCANDVPETLHRGFPPLDICGL